MAIAKCALCGRSVPVDDAKGWLLERRADGSGARLCDRCIELAANVVLRRDSDRATKLIAAGWKSVRHGWWRREIMGPSFSLGDAWARLQAETAAAELPVPAALWDVVLRVDGGASEVVERVTSPTSSAAAEVARSRHRGSEVRGVTEVGATEVRS